MRSGEKKALASWHLGCSLLFVLWEAMWNLVTTSIYWSLLYFSKNCANEAVVHKILDRVLSRYDVRLRPNFGGKPRPDTRSLCVSWNRAEVDATRQPHSPLALPRLSMFASLDPTLLSLHLSAFRAPTLGPSALPWEFLPLLCLLAQGVLLPLPLQQPEVHSLVWLEKQ